MVASDDRFIRLQFSFGARWVDVRIETGRELAAMLTENAVNEAAA